MDVLQNVSNLTCPKWNSYFSFPKVFPDPQIFPLPPNIAPSFQLFQNKTMILSVSSRQGKWFTFILPSCPASIQSAYDSYLGITSCQFIVMSP